MKKRIQKYLAGEREGFSLVELIIVIAIMAILIGVVALAVLPNIGRSRESKDLQTLDNVLASANVAIANKKVTKGGSFTISSTGAYADTSSGAGKDVMDAVQEELGKVTLGSLDSATITVEWVMGSTSSAATVKVSAAKSGDSTPSKCEYTDSSDTDPEIADQSTHKRIYCVKSKAS